jgi:methionyl aminopeptidase
VPQSVAMPAHAAVIRTPAEIEAVAAAGRLLWSILQDAQTMVRPGIRTRQIAAEIDARIRAAKADPVLLEQGFPAAASICLNDEVVHAPPGETLIRHGDLVTIDAALRLDGWCADAAISIAVGGPGSPGTQPARDLAQTSMTVLAATLAAIRPGVAWSEAAGAAFRAAESAGCRLIREYAGHGIGRGLHEAPALPFLPPGAPLSQDPILLAGMTLAIEPIVSRGSGEIYGQTETWTVRTADKALACYHEVTIAVIDAGVRVLTGPG